MSMVSNSQPNTLFAKILPWLIPSIAALAYGTWAGFANFGYPTEVWLKAALGQGVYAFISTWVVTTIARQICVYCGLGWRGIITGFLGSFVVMTTIPIVIHHALGTPNWFLAILPGLIWGSLYVISYLLYFSRQQKVQSNLQSTV